MQGGYEKSRFSANISLYLGNDTKQSHSYYEMRTGNRIQATEWRHFHLERLLTQISRSHHYLTLNISENTDIVTVEY